MKFTRSYSVVTHIFLESRSFTPRLIGYRYLSAGWHAVMMEDLLTKEPKFRMLSLASHGTRLPKDLGTAVCCS